MGTLLIINDNSSEAKHAAEFALAIAQNIKVDLMLANNFVKSEKRTAVVTSGDIDRNTADEHADFGLLEHLTLLSSQSSDFKPEIEEFDVSEIDEVKLAEIINQKQTWMMVKGMPETMAPTTTERRLNAHTVLNKVLCPLLLIPENWQIKNIERMAYIADLRYCRLHIVNYLAKFAKAYNADLSIAHMSAKGLPDMAEKYALTIFSDEISQNVAYDQLFFNNIKEKNLSKAIDVIINGMHNDVLVMVNHRFHFEEIVGRYITDTMPMHITIPLLIFPY